MYGKVESGGDVKYKETARLKCDAGFIVNDTTLTEKDVTCGSDAMFSGLDPCVSKSSVLLHAWSSFFKAGLLVIKVLQDNFWPILQTE